MTNLSVFAQSMILNKSTMFNRQSIMSDGTIYSRSWDHQTSIWLRNMTGYGYDLGEAIRAQAERASLEKRHMDVLEITYDMPIKAIELLGYGFRHMGDFLIYGDHGAHNKTEIRSVAIADWDWLQAVFEHELDMTAQEYYDLYSHIIMPAFNFNCRHFHKADYKVISEQLRQVYKDLKKSGAFTMLSGTTDSVVNYTTAITRLAELEQSGQRFDLVYVDPHGTQDKFLCFMGVQKVLKPHGIAYVPVDWWIPNELGSKGVTGSTLWKETVHTGEHLAVFLAREYPQAFDIAHFPGAATLIIKGTDTPVNW